jgi:cobalamin transport system substrate-binding protein
MIREPGYLLQTINPEEDEMKKFGLFVSVFIVVLMVFVSCGNPVVVDDLGYDITTEKAPQRIVSLTPNITEMLFYLGVGDRVVARTSFCNYPPEVSEIPAIGDMMNLSVETILDFEPDLVIANRMVPMEIIEQLRQISSKKIIVSAFDPDSIEGVISTIDRIATLCHVPSKSKELLNQMNKLKAEKSNKLVYVEIWGDPPMTFGKNTFGSDLIKWAGCTNLGDKVAGDFPTTTHESIIDLNPDVIIIPDPYGETVEGISSRPGYSEITAVKNGKVFSVDADIIMRPGPRMVLALAELIKIISD